ncbi:Sodium-coupled neutral amino acid transporter 2 [Durusdinium trenchii]|uniref:Sodium-coupled neutral amino acid transporter 2 n=1 Tax=Durusdinium trenchii TaxID=1381693 RepID=A0ABP0I8X6_9DINO
MAGLESLCFEPVGESTEAKWLYQPGQGSYRKVNSYQHVGVGKGDFIKEDGFYGGEWVPVGKGSGSFIRIQTYQHVGEGLGDYDKEEITSYSAWRLRPSCVVLFSLILLGLVALLAFMSFGSGSAWDTLKSNVGLQSYDCSAEFEQWRNAWSEGKRQWCCRTANRGCAATHSFGDRSSQDLYDCNSNVQTWREAWTPGQKLWCCSVYHRGCEAPHQGGPEEGLYNCRTGGSPSVWTLSKQHWCCQKTGIGCNLATHGPGGGSPPVSFNCHVEQVGQWSVMKRHWCCAHQKLGCAHAAPRPAPPVHVSHSEPFDCMAGFLNWQQAAGRKVYLAAGMRVGAERRV